MTDPVSLTHADVLVWMGYGVTLGLSVYYTAFAVFAPLRFVRTVGDIAT